MLIDNKMFNFVLVGIKKDLKYEWNDKYIDNSILFIFVFYYLFFYLFVYL